MRTITTQVRNGNEKSKENKKRNLETKRFTGQLSATRNHVYPWGKELSRFKVAQPVKEK